MASLSQNKASLFGNSTGAKPSVTGVSKQTAGVKPVGSSGLKTGSASALPRAAVKKTLEISAEAKARKLAEANILAKAGDDYLATSFFKWSPDHLGASSKYEHASNAYKVAGEALKACIFMEKAAKAHAAYESFGTAASSFANASKLAAALLENVEEAVRLQLAAGEMWSLYGDLYQVASSYLAAAELCENSDSDRAVELYEQGRDILCPTDALDEDLKRTNVRGLDAMRKIFKFLIRDTQRLAKAMSHAELMVRLFRAFEQDDAVHKILASITVIQLHMKDVVSADQTFMEHLSIRGYTSSKACEIAEELVQAMKSYDSDALAAVLRSESMQYLDRDVQLLAKTLTMRSGTASASTFVESVVTRQAGDKQQTVRVLAEAVVSINEENKVSGSGSVEASDVELNLPLEAAAPEVSDVEGEEEDLDLC